MKKILLLNLLIIIGFSLFSQGLKNKVEVSFGEEFKIKNKLLTESIFAEDETGYYSIKLTFEKFKIKKTLQHFDRTMNLIKTSAIDFSFRKKEKQYEGLLMINGKIKLLTSTINEKAMKKELFIESVNKESLTLINDLKKIAEYDILKKRRKNSGFFDCVVSTDKSKTLIYYSLPFEKETQERFGFQVYDQSMNLLWEKEITLPYDDASFSIEDYKIGDNGEVYLVGKLFNSETSNYSHELLVYSSNGNNVDQHTFKIDNKYISGIKVDILENQNIICAGFYSNLENYNSKDGCFYTVLDSKSKEVIHKNTKAFSLDFLTQNMSEKKEGKVEKKANKGKSIGFDNYDFKHIINKKDGGYYLIAEQFYTNEYTVDKINYNNNNNNKFNPRKKSVKEYFYNDIIVISVSSDGDIIWNKKIPKRQKTKNDNGALSSFGAHYVNNNLYLLFNDNAKNNNFEAGDKVYKYGTNLNPVLTIVEITNEGSLERETLLSKEDTRLWITPTMMFNISENEFLLFGRSLKTSQYMKFNFK